MLVLQDYDRKRTIKVYFQRNYISQNNRKNDYSNADLSKSNNTETKYITQQRYFYSIINKVTKMSIAAKNQFEMKLLKQLLTAKLNPWIGILVSLLIIVPSLYQILDDVTVLRKEYLFLAVGFPLYVKSLKNLFDEMLKTPDDL